MNANDLAYDLNLIAKLLKNRHRIPLYCDYGILYRAETIIRQQQAEIEALKAEKEKLFMGMLDMALDAEIKDLKNGN
jgi:cell division protein FtsB